MNFKETDPRLVEAKRERKPPMFRCWVNEHSTAILFPEEVHVIVEAGERRDWNIVSRNEIVLLGVSKDGDALGPYRDAYVHVRLYPQFSDEKSYRIQLSGCDEIRMKVPKGQIIFAQPNDPIWDEIKEKLEKESEGKISELKSLSNDQMAVRISDGSAVLIGEK
jgi:hypothetical protein